MRTQVSRRTLAAELRETPLVALVEGDDLYVFASKGGAPTNPDWYHNLKAHPRITVEFGTDTFTADVIEMPEADGQAKLRAQAELMPQFGEYVTRRPPDHPGVPHLTRRLIEVPVEFRPRPARERLATLRPAR